MATNLRTPPPIGEKLFCCLVILASTNAFHAILHGPDTDPLNPGSPVTTVMWATMYAITGFLSLKHSRLLLLISWRRIWLFVSLTLFALASAAWSDAPGLTMLRGVTLIGTTLFSVYVGSRFTLREQLTVLAWPCGIAAVLSLIFAIAFPSYGIGTGESENAWIGIFPHKNALGATMVIGCCVFLVLSDSEPRHKWILRAFAVLAFILILFADSATSLVAWVLVICSYLYLRRRENRDWPTVYKSLMFAGLIFLMIIAPFHAQILTGLGRDSGLTGRVVLWGLVWQMIRERPLMGYGYGAFWAAPDNPLPGFLNSIGFNFPHAHSGFLNLWLDVGVVGLIIFVAGYSVYIKRALDFAREARCREAIWPLMVFILTLLLNITETNLLVANSLPWILYGISVASLAQRKAATENPELWERSMSKSGVLLHLPVRPAQIAD